MAPNPKRPGQKAPGNPGVRRGPMKYVLTNCSRSCSMNPDNLPGKVGALIHTWFEEANNNQTIIEKAATLGVKLSNGSVGRHRRNHLTPADDASDPTLAGPVVKMSDLQVLEEVINRGAQHLQLSVARVSTEQLLRAIELKHKLTEGSMFEDFFGALVAEGEGAEEGPTNEAPQAAEAAEVLAEAAPDES